MVALKEKLNIKEFWVLPISPANQSTFCLSILSKLLKIIGTHKKNDAGF